MRRSVRIRPRAAGPHAGDKLLKGGGFGPIANTPGNRRADSDRSPTHRGILADHRWFEEALRELRDITGDRAGVLADLAAVLLAHAEAEESKVYPSLRRKKAIDAQEVERARARRGQRGTAGADGGR